MKKVLSLLIILAVVLSSTAVFANDIRVPENLPTETLPTQSSSAVKQETPKVTFSDVDANTATGKAIYKLVNAGILNGYEDGTFRPNNPLTRAELCKIVNLVFNYTESEEVSFSDMTKNDWFYNYVAVAKKAGYITGHADGTFKGNDYLTREQTCTIITRVTELFDISMTETITDAVSQWAVPYVNKVVANKLMPLEEGGKFRATENITRAELVVVMSRFVTEEQKPAENTTGTQYTVTFNTNGGNSIAAVKVESGKTVAKPANPTKTGYTFAGWYSDSGLTKTFDFNTKITANTTLYAKWNRNGMSGGGSSGGGGSSSGGGSSGGGSSSGGGTTTPTEYTVTFNTNGGSTIDKVSVEKGDTVSEPSAPEKEGYRFAGWYSNSGLTTAFDFGTAITKNMTIYAKWIKTYVVSFEMNGGESMEAVIVDNGATLEEPARPEMSGYYFIGWYRNAEFISKFNFETKITKDTVIYAKWIEWDPEKQEEVLGEMNSLLDDVEPFIGEFELDAANEILQLVYNVMKSVIADGAMGIPVYDGDYILDNYGQEISDANDLYDGMSKDEQSNFYSVLLTELGEEKADKLLQTMFGINISDAKDKIDK